MLLKSINPREETERSFQGAFHAALGLLGWILPDRRSTAIAASKADEHLLAELPNDLKDPFAVLDQRASAHASLLNHGSTADTSDESVLVEQFE